MCWGVHCTDGLFSRVLTYDNPSKKELNRRRRNAGCIKSGGNRCTAKNSGVTGENCDEFPFASTAESGQANGDQINRCVPKGQNSKQGGTLSGFYKRQNARNVAPLTFEIAFSNPTAAGVLFCTNAEPNPCVSDANLRIGKTDVQVGDPIAFTPRQLSRPRGVMYLYKTKAGTLLSSPSLLEVGRPVHTFVSNMTAEMADFGATNYEDSYELVMDEIQEVLTEL
ncbi:hypothetical protein ACHAQH_007749 [Verticillium albo-atrum]